MSEVGDPIQVDANENTHLLSVTDGSATYKNADEFMNDDQDKNSVSIVNLFFYTLKSYIIDLIAKS